VWWLKGIGSLLILGGCGFFGWEKGAELRREIRLLREMIQSLILFKSLTGTYRLPLNMVFLRISLQMKPPVSEFYEKLSGHFARQEKPEGVLVWQQTVEEMSGSFGKDSRELFMGLGHFIGIQDVGIQAAAVEDCIQEIRERLSLLESERRNREKLYQVLSLTIGGFLIILFV
jgi:stage III sporulation protein AB